MKFIQKIKPYLAKIDQGLDLYIPQSTTRPEQLHQAMRYSLEAGGKRLRPLLLLLASELRPHTNDPLPAAIAIECIHTYSLIHDDLPCMDNSPLRRGRPSCHIQFDEATALLAGDALLTLAFQILSTHYSNNPQLALSLIQDLSLAAGSHHLIAGQMEDLLAEQSSYSSSSTLHSIQNNTSSSTTTLSIDFDYINANKTGKMIASALSMGARLATHNTDIIANYHLIGLNIGLAYQIVDDILDEVSTEAVLGKSVGLDDKNNKLTYPKLHGLTQSKEAVNHYTQQALKICNSVGGNNSLILELIQELQERIH